MKETTRGKRRRVMVAAIGDCVHTLGVESFAEWMEDQGLGYVAVKLGPAVPIQNLIDKIREARPEVVGISTRLGDLHVDRMIDEFVEKAHRHGLDPATSGIRYSFGGLRPAANLVRAMTGQPILPDKFSPEEERNYDLEEVAAKYAGREAYKDFFELIVDDHVTMEELTRFARGLPPQPSTQETWSDDLIERIRQVRERENRPIIRAHIGIAADKIEPTIEGVERLAESGALEIVSLAPDQPSQAQGTDELIELARLFEETLHMPFPAVPIFFYNELDGRGPLSILDGLHEHFRVMQWWAEQGKPLEVNDPHQWQLRNCSDDMYVVDHVVSAVVAYQAGIRDYIMQLMFNLPPEISATNDLAKMQAAYELISAITDLDPDFNIIKETRGGLASFPPNLDRAKGHLAATTHWQLYMEPDIVHVVSFSEAHHEAKDYDIVESCDIVKQVMADFAQGPQPDVFKDPKLVTLENFDNYDYSTMLQEFMEPANYTTGEYGLTSPDNLDLALQTGLFQAPKITVLDKRYEMVGKCRTRIIDGSCVIDEFDNRKVADEFERVDRVRQRSPWYFDPTISRADEESFIREVPEEIDQGAVERYRRLVGVDTLEDKNVLVVDFGSTFSKIGTFNTSDNQFHIEYVPTTPDDLRWCLAHGLGVQEECEASGSWEPLRQRIEDFDLRLPCSSAKGGLKMVNVSLVETESGEAAELAALTAGAKLLNTYAGELSTEDVRAIFEDDQPEIILITGGVDYGGDTQTQLHNARALADGAHLATYAKYGVPVIYAGNQDVADQVQDIFERAGVDLRITQNVMPEVNDYQIEVVNEAIRELFQTIIIRGKGFDVVEEFMSAKFIPTPRAAFLGINLLAKGYGDEKGFGNVVALDIGGATTDFYANVSDNPLYRYPGQDPVKSKKRTILKTPNAPIAYRRVEGKYGLSYDAENLLDLPEFQDGSMKAKIERALNRDFPDLEPADPEFLQFLDRGANGWSIELHDYLRFLSANPHHLPSSPEETRLRSYLAQKIMKIATGNNVGYVHETDAYFLQHGVNFLNQDCTIVLIGGTIYHKCRDNKPHHLRDLEIIATGALHTEEEPLRLRPSGPVLLDASYLVSIIGGLYGRVDPEGALRIMKKNLRPLM